MGMVAPPQTRPVAIPGSNGSFQSGAIRIGASVRFFLRVLNASIQSSINTSIVFSIMLWKIAIIHLWNVPGALQRPKGMRR
ncbi:hypothetical protein Tco_1219936 [Tanacetum coccineum]